MYDDFNYWKFGDIKDLEALEKEHEYPPRFRIQCIRKSENSSVDLYFPFVLSKKMNNKETEDIGSFTLVKNVAGNAYHN